VVECDLCERSVCPDHVSLRLPLRLQTLFQWMKPALPVNGRYEVHCHRPIRIKTPSLAPLLLSACSALRISVCASAHLIPCILMS